MSTDYGYVCNCPRGTSGMMCESRSAGCDVMPCNNGGSCVQNKDGAFVCQCSPQYRGRLHELTMHDGLVMHDMACYIGGQRLFCQINDEQKNTKIDDLAL